jgi:transcriptional regulator with PAS, ATPase and Fis domain
MLNERWLKEFSGAVTVTDLEGRIIYLNEKAAQVFAREGGLKLLGKNIFDCHKRESQEKIRRIIKEKTPNVYTIEKEGIKKLIYQTPWKVHGQVRGLVELSLEIPFELPHFVRD